MMQDEYFQVDNSAIKHDGFFVNRGKLERMLVSHSLNSIHLKFLDINPFILFWYYLHMVITEKHNQQGLDWYGWFNMNRTWS